MLAIEQQFVVLIANARKEIVDDVEGKNRSTPVRGKKLVKQLQRTQLFENQGRSIMCTYAMLPVCSRMQCQ
jgi:hypothetical protein